MVVVSYSRADKVRVAELTAILREHGLAVWYDRELTTGEFELEIENQIHRAVAVIVVWSESAVQSQWVRAEAALALELGKAISVRIDKVASARLPLRYKQENCIDLSDWTEGGSPDVTRIVEAAHALRANDDPEPDPDDPLLEQVADVARNRTNFTILRRLAIGEVSRVYLGRLNRRLVTVKMIRDGRLASGTPSAAEARDTALREIDKSAHLEHPCFLRIADAFHHAENFYVVTDFAPSRTIRAVMGDETRAGGRFDVVSTVGILHQLAEALIDGQRCGLRFLAVNPSEVYLNHDETSGEARAQLTPLNFAYFLAQLAADTNVLFTLEKGPFTAPERFVVGLLAPPTTRDEEQWAIDRANQFSLGMLGWTMLEGRQPFLGVEGESAYHRMRRFEQEAPSFSQRVAEAPWRSEGQALFRVIERMVRFRPEERWTDMTQVSHLLGALEGEQAGAEVERGVKAAYHEVCHGNEGFYNEFYGRLFTRAPHLKAIFPMGETPEAQAARLDGALGQLLNYREQQREPTTLSAIRASHRPRGLTGDDYRHFGHALIETFEQRLPDDEQREARLAALEIVIWPALYYFIDDLERAG